MTESWLPVVGYEGLYEVSSLGNVRSCDRVTTHGRRRKSQPMRPANVRAGYLAVQLWSAGTGRMRFIAVLVAEAFIGPRPDGMQVCHNDGVKTNNAAANLRYDTPTGNQADRVAHDTHIRGDRSPNAKLNWDAVSDIRSSKDSDSELARRYAVSRKAVLLVRQGRTWVGGSNA